MATIKDVAREAGFSIATVSCALSGKKNVSYNARVKILAAIEKLKFVPNESARKLKLGPGREIGVLLTSIDDLYHSEIFKGITSVIQGNNFSVIIGFSNNEPRSEAGITKDFIARNFAGIILISCLSNDSAYIKGLLFHGIPVVFIERRPKKKDLNFVGISNKKTIRFLVENLKERGCRNISLFCGSPVISSESDCVKAFRECFPKSTGSFKGHIHYTNMTREDAFRVAMTVFYSNPQPDAIIATSENITHGLLEGAKVLGVPLDKSIIITFSEETWMGTRYLPRVFHTSRPAFSLGVNAANLLLRNIAGEAEKSETVLLDDNVLKTGIELPRYSPARKKLPDRKLPARKSPELRLLMLESSFSSDAIKILAPKFRNDYGVSLVIDTEVQDRLFNRILEDAQLSNPFYDIYMFDIPWLNFLVQNGFLEDISNFITRDKVYYNSIIKEILRNSMYQGRYYSIPFLGGAQLMFYRIDVFEDPILSKDYFNTCGTKLRPPRTWPEFNTVAKFFTRKYNRSSPVEFGASCHGAIAEEICPDIYSRIWGFGGQVFNRKNLPELYSENNIRAFENLIELQNYTPSPVLSGSILEAVRDFYTGKSAMLVTFTEYAAKIMDAINRNIFGKLGFTFIPARTPISVGWNLGINIFSRKKETALEFFNWLYRKDLSYYLTILGGQGTSVYPYENNELLKLYPWMQITIENFKFVRNRLTSHKKNSIVIPWNKIENIIYLNTKRMFAGESPETCLRAMDSEITGLMSVYGHFRGNN